MINATCEGITIVCILLTVVYLLSAMLPLATIYTVAFLLFPGAYILISL